ncbi:MAG: class I SAM-dependent methyltransferase [Bacillota bacterium]
MIETRLRQVKIGDLTLDIKETADINMLLSGVETDDDIPFWSVLWPSAIALARFLRAQGGLAGCRVLELGAGVGLAGLVAALEGGRVTQTDFVPDALTLQKANAELNGLTGITHELADWRNFDLSRKYDWIIGSDILYEPKLHGYLKQIFRCCLSEKGTLILADPGREGGKIFVESLLEEGFRGRCEEITVEFDGLVYRVNIYILNKSD